MIHTPENGVSDVSNYEVLHGDSLEILRGMSDCSVDAVVTDPPYGLSQHKPAVIADTLARWVNGDTEYVPPASGGFAGRAWDSFVPPPAVWAECLRVLKPGGHLVAFAGARTQDLMGLSVRLGGFEIREGLQWLYGTGNPTGSLDMGKQFDREAGHLGTERGRRVYAADVAGVRTSYEFGYVRPAPVTDEAQQWDGWRTRLKPAVEPAILARRPVAGKLTNNLRTHGTGALNVGACMIDPAVDKMPSPRYPANVLLDEDVTELLGDKAKFFHTFRYQAKAPTKERPQSTTADGRVVKHPTVKPLGLMEWLVTLVTPPGGVVLDPFAGSGTTGEAAYRSGFDSILIEGSADYLPLIHERYRRSATSDTDTEV